MTLSVVIICKNEQRFIAKCIEAALRATDDLPDREIILVDSCSVDNTIAIASKYPVTILQLRPGWRHTPAAGRYIGTLRSCGEFIMFVDGDSHMQAGFIEKAVDVFLHQPKVAAIVGRRREIYWKDGVIVGEEWDINRIGPQTRLVSLAPGSAIYRASALAKVGCFNPYLFADEEAELGERLVWAGFEILATPVDMVVHNTVPREQVSSLFRRMKNNFTLGTGQVIRYRVSAGFSARAFLRREARLLQFLAWLGAGGVALGMAALINHWGLALAWGMVSALLLLGFIVKSQSIVKPFKYALIWTIQAYSIIKGFLLKPNRPSDYPTDAVVLKQVNYSVMQKPKKVT